MTIHGSFLSGIRAGGEGISVPRIAVIGRGFSGLMMAIALLRRVRTPFHLQLFDPHPDVSGGQALAAARTAEILNSRVRDLSVADDDPDDFDRWLGESPDFRNAVSAAIPGFRQIFVPKSTFSDYAYQRFSDALALRHDVTVRIRSETAMRIARQTDGFTVAASGGLPEAHDIVILATGYGRNASAEAGQSAAEGSRVRARRLQPAPHIVLLGTGVRVVDRLFQLRDGGYAGRITLLSSHGFLPQSHTRLSADPVDLPAPMPHRLSEIVRFLRQACRAAEAEGQSWQSVMNAFRKQARSLWRSLPASEKRRFNRHLRAIYDSHRNRLPEPHYLRLMRELSAGCTVLRKGRVESFSGDGVHVRWPGRQDADYLHASAVFDCRCAAPDLTAPPLADLIGSGLAMPDELGLGLMVNGCGGILVDGEAIANLYAIGPLGLGSLPDIDLVPEIVAQTYAAASLMAETCRSRMAA